MKFLILLLIVPIMSCVAQAHHKKGERVGGDGVVIVDSVVNVNGQITSYSGGVALDSGLYIANAQLADSLGWYFIDAATYGDSLADATAHFRNVIASAGSGKVYIPGGVYLVSDSIYTNLSPHLVGVSSDMVGTPTKIILTRDKPFLYVDSLSGSPYGTGGSVENIYFYGSNSADSTNQHAIVFNANKRWTVDNCTFRRLGGHSVKLGDDNDAIMITIKNNHFSYNHGTLIHGRRTATTTINAIDIINNHMYENFNHCVDVAGQAVNVLLNKIEFNDSCAIMVNPIDQSGINCFVTGNVIKYNRFEDNEGGEIFIWQEYVGGSENHLNYGTVIEDNIFIVSLASYDKPEATAMITVEQGPDGTSSSYLKEFKIGHNTFIESAGMPYVDLGGDGSGGVKEDTKVWIKEEVDVSAYYLNMGGATLEYDGMDISPPISTGLDANGFAAADIHPVAYVSFSGDTLDITNNPQIADAQVDGYIMIIINGDATGYLKLDDGNGLDLISTSIYLAPNDIMAVMYSDDEDLWMQLTHPKSYWETITVTGSIYVTDAGGSDSLRIYDDGDTHQADK